MLAVLVTKSMAALSSYNVQTLAVTSLHHARNVLTKAFYAKRSMLKSDLVPHEHAVVAFLRQLLCKLSDGRRKHCRTLLDAPHSLLVDDVIARRRRYKRKCLN